MVVSIGNVGNGHGFSLSWREGGYRFPKQIIPDMIHAVCKEVINKTDGSHNGGYKAVRFSQVLEYTAGVSIIVYQYI